MANYEVLALSLTLPGGRTFSSGDIIEDISLSHVKELEKKDLIKKVTAKSSKTTK